VAVGHLRGLPSGCMEAVLIGIATLAQWVVSVNTDKPLALEPACMIVYSIETALPAIL